MCETTATERARWEGAMTIALGCNVQIEISFGKMGASKR